MQVERLIFSLKKKGKKIDLSIAQKKVIFDGRTSLNEISID